MSDPRAALIPIGALISYGLNYQAALPDVHENNDELVIEERSSYGYLPADNLQDLVAGVLASVDEEGEHEIKVGGGYLYVRASAPAIAAARSLLQRMQDEMLRNVEIVHAAHIEPAESTVVAGATRPLLHGLWLPTLLGREASAYRLHETNVVANIFVEVAPEAGSLAPSVQLLQSGAWFRCRLAPVGQSLHANVDLQTVVAPTPAMRSVMPGGGVLMQAEVAGSTGRPRRRARWHDDDRPRRRPANRAPGPLPAHPDADLVPPLSQAPSETAPEPAPSGQRQVGTGP